MGICLETEKKNEAEELEYNDGSSIWFTDGHELANLENSSFATQNEGHVKFEMPKIPVIFVLGGPGSGKVTHCDNLAEEKRGIIHINMTDLLQQYSTGGGGEMKDFNLLPSRTVAEVLMLEMKMSPAAKTFLISGYPRNMRDVVEYTEKIKTVSGVIQLVWKQSNLERQIEYGAKLGHVVFSLARMELNNFYKYVTPVADFYDQRKLLISINGERNPAEVYNDFRVAVLRIIGSKDVHSSKKPTIPNGKVSVAQQETRNMSMAVASTNIATATVSVHKPPTKEYPPVIYVVGGPGSNKAHLIQKVLHRISGWGHISVGTLLRTKIDAREWPAEKAQTLRETIAAGEMLDKETINETLDNAMLHNINAKGVILEGYPRDLKQLHEFEEKYEQHPRIILLDCSKLQLSRGRWDDSITAFRKRLEIFREKTLPMLKVLDIENRLTMVDGDTDTIEVQEAFAIALSDAIKNIQEEFTFSTSKSNQSSTPFNSDTSILQDVEDDIFNSTSSKPQMNGCGPPRDRGGTSRIGSNVVTVSHMTNNRESAFPP